MNFRGIVDALTSACTRYERAIFSARAFAAELVEATDSAFCEVALVRERRLTSRAADDEEAQGVVDDVFGLLYERPERYLARPVLCAPIYGLTTRACFNRIRSHKPLRTTRSSDANVEAG